MRTMIARVALSLTFLLALVAMTSCSSTSMVGNALLITEPTTGPNDLTLTITRGPKSSVSGMQVDTVGDDTIVTYLKDGKARRFILTGLVGYRGRIRLNSVDLVLGDTSVWITNTRLKAHGPGGTIDIPLHDTKGNDLFRGRDIIMANGAVRAVE